MPGMVCAYPLSVHVWIVFFPFRVCPIYVYAVNAWIVWHMFEGPGSCGLLFWDPALEEPCCLRYVSVIVFKIAFHLQALHCAAIPARAVNFHAYDVHPEYLKWIAGFLGELIFGC